MQFAIINATERTISMVDCDNILTAQKIAGLGNVDHGVCAPGIGIVVYEFGLKEPPDRQVYFAIFRHLYAGNAVLYGFNKEGASVDLMAIPPVVFMPSARAVERNIELGIVQRPQIAVNGDVIWEWFGGDK